MCLQYSEMFLTFMGAIITQTGIRCRQQNFLPFPAPLHSGYVWFVFVMPPCNNNTVSQDRKSDMLVQFIEYKYPIVLSISFEVNMGQITKALYKHSIS